MEKIKILVAPGDRSGSGKYRCVDPHVNLQNNYPNDFFVEINYNVNFDDIDYLKQFQIVFFHRVAQNKYELSTQIITNLKKLGLKVVVDLDDYWFLDPSHGSYETSKHFKIGTKIIEAIKLADLVTVTTKLLANELKRFNKNIVVLPNAIDPNEEQFKPKPTTSDRVRFGWLGGSSHIKDIELLAGIGTTIDDFKNKAQIVLCGFNVNGEVRVLDKETNQIKKRPMQPQETVWFLYEAFLTNYYRLLENDERYLKHLMSFKDDSNFNDLNKVYRRIWTKPITQYGLSYNHFDVALAPLKDNEFNRFKSQLKIIEAGFHKKAIIAQNYGPYTIDLISVIKKGGEIDTKGNSLLVDVNKNHKQWNQHVKKLIANPQLVIDLGEKLYETVKDEYNLNNVTKIRSEIYKNITK